MNGTDPLRPMTRLAKIKAAERMDWRQVVANGGPPCFHVMEDGRFCGRAERWFGHDEDHRFVSLANLLQEAMK